MSDVVKSPDHYGHTRLGEAKDIVADVLMSWPDDISNEAAWWAGDAMTYIIRAPYKGGATDFRKASECCLNAARAVEGGDGA